MNKVKFIRPQIYKSFKQLQFNLSQKSLGELISKDDVILKQKYKCFLGGNIGKPIFTQIKDMEENDIVKINCLNPNFSVDDITEEMKVATEFPVLTKKLELFNVISLSPLKL